MVETPLVWTGPGWAPGLSKRLGGKGANLARLRGAGQPVPPFYVVTTDTFPAAAGSREAVLAAPLPPGLMEAVERAHRATIPEHAFVAVRSSASDEDAPGHSFAGLHDSFVFVKGLDRVLDAVKKVWASGFSDRAVAYRRERGLPAARVAVVVQQMVDAAASGVAFTANPVTNDVHEIVVNAVLGAGEGLVGAGFNPDSWTFRKPDLSAETRIATKEKRLVFDETAGGGLKTADVPEELRAKPCLTPAQASAVARAAIMIERLYGRPQDIEFSVDIAGKLFVLQARPVTTVLENGPAAGNRVIWDNSNIVESYAGVTTPMTFSFIRRAYTIVYHCFASVMGVPRRVVAANAATFENMLGLHRGRVYYNILNWYRLVRLFPGFAANRRFMESMMGVKEPADLDEPVAAPTLARRLLVEYPALAKLVLRSAWNFLRIRRIVAGFESLFRLHYGRWSRVDFRAMAPHELLATYREMERELLWNWKAPIINDFYVMIFYGLLKKLCAGWCGEASGTLQNDLLAGEGGIESTEPARKLAQIAALARRDPALREALLNGTPEAALAFPAFADAFREFLDLYGFRCMDELKLEALSLKDDPRFVFQILRNHLRLEKEDDPAAALERERAIRRGAEERAFGKLGFFHALVFRRVLRAARLGVKNRENMRFARTRIYGVLREMIRAMGERFAEERILDARDDVFYLTLDEVWDFVKGTAVTTDLRGLSALRKREFEAHCAAETPDSRFETYGMACHRNLYRGAKAVVVAPNGALKGVGCSPGVVTGPVKVIASPSDDVRLAGEILVADRTDPGWVPLYPFVSGILVERGSILSHSAIVAREMGIPTIVGVPGLLAAVTSGQWVKMDGSTGEIALVTPPATAESPAPPEGPR